MDSSASSTQRYVICMKWGTKYGPEYVNRLHAMVKRHLTLDFQMVCLTDDATGIHPDVRCLPIPALDLPPGSPERGWTKLVTFSEDLHGLQGTALFLDVDVVIVGSLDGFFRAARPLPDHQGLRPFLESWTHHWQFVGLPIRVGRAPRCAGQFSEKFRCNPPALSQ